MTDYEFTRRTESFISRKFESSRLKNFIILKYLINRVTLRYILSIINI